MEKIVLFLLIFIATTAINAQEIFFPTSEGKILVYKMFDKKNKETGMLRYTIKEVNISGDNMDIIYLVESLDSKGKEEFKEEITLNKKGDVLYFDMSNFINKSAFQQDGEMPPGLEIKGNNLEVPINPQPGTTLPDANIEMAIKMGFVNMKIATNIINRKVELIEDVTVPAGIFNCYKFTGDVTNTVMGKKISSTTAEWYTRGLGVVKSESYDKNGKLNSYMVLTEVN